MNQSTVKKFHPFLPWQDDQQEKWLQKMSQQGLHLAKVASWGSFYFQNGSPMEYAYCLDFNVDKKLDDYIDFIRDSGWEYLGASGGWHYWRKAVEDGQAPLFFSDTESKIQKYQRLFRFYATSSPGAAIIYIITAAQYKRFPGRLPLWVVITVLSICFLYILITALVALGIGLRMRELKKGR
jgi:hypothetical protein